MPPARGEIGFGDLLIALEATAPDDATRMSVAEALGFEVSPAAESVDPDPVRPDRGRLGATSAVRRSATPPTVVHDLAEQELPLLEPLGRREVSPTGVVAAALAREIDATTIAVVPTRRQLLSPTEARGRVVALASQDRLVGPIDIPKLVRSIALLRPSTEVPRLRRSRMRPEVWFICDVNVAMTPFRADQNDLLELLGNLVGTDSVTVRYIFGDPSAALIDDDGRTSVPIESFVIAFSDFGSSATDNGDRESTAGAWLDLAKALARKGSELVGATPYPADRWPPQCRDAFPIVQLDRRVQTAVGGSKQ